MILFGLNYRGWFAGRHNADCQPQYNHTPARKAETDGIRKKYTNRAIISLQLIEDDSVDEPSKFKANNRIYNELTIHIGICH